MIDSLGRNIEYLRISVTDKCNLRCLYCMPDEGIKSLKHSEILNFDEIIKILRCMTVLGVHSVRLTGGEPLVRRDCIRLISMIKDVDGIDRVAMTTNGILLGDRVREVVQAGLDDVNISIDSLNPDVYRRMSRGGDVRKVLSCINNAVDAGLGVKLNSVPVMGLNDTGLCELAGLARELPVAVRFIELMPLGCGMELMPVPIDKVRSDVEEEYGPLSRDETPHGMGPAVYYKPQGFKGSIGFIGAVSHEFCDRCNRVRLTSDGRLKLCLNHSSGLDLKTLIRSGCTDDELVNAIKDAIIHKPVNHGFMTDIADPEPRRMNQIGG